MNRLPNLDALRFFLASFVILFHIPLLSKNQGLPYFDSLEIFHKGIQAVYMFFVLSGFLIIRLIYRAKINNTFSIKQFYMRRVLRILPLYYLIVFFGFLFYHLILPILNIPFEINYDLKEGLLLTIFFLPNVFSKLYSPGGILEILWSIGIEEQFYLFIAPLLFCIKRKYILFFLTIIVSLYFVIFHSSTFNVLREFSFVYFYLLFGGIVSILEEERKLEFIKRKALSIIIVTFAIIYFITDWLVVEIIWLNNFLTCILFSLFILTISYNNFGVEIKSRFIKYLGNISYGIYMYHVIALNIVVFLFLSIEKFDFFGNFMTVLLINILTFALTILISHVSYKYFELYFLKLKNKFRK
ncbi:acyltransferase [Yeosuana sp. MJ-SS3]|uniref:Acyltransferase n=1 Tax=Gilvirhabdus luticola TaxID=3079858 RepID=A0ABU3U8U3_9FLAO|nr:acyltransferase [Yeosuana sp. MJ-SS3]MDU8886834.1 acyltransferase [Yeosuana sp. MJ-SS3]